ncbi:MAG: nucleotidyltransferase family protein [Acutalibacteraceae bacterium]|nr:nucleotidyltransferase family protein [Acutalibacteraceae bacterium]
MLTAGIIAEYNPFHNGHALLIEKARAAGATHIVAVMSGNFVQRGEPALFHHIQRTKAALCGGADLVVQLPVPYAVSGAQSFARTGVEILNSLGMVDWLVFGSECGNSDLINETADAVYGENIKTLLGDELSKGISFASARENALRSINPVYADVIKSPNNILGVEYAAAIQRIGSKMKPVTFVREGAEHDSTQSGGNIASASLIRKNIINGGEWQSFVPDADVYNDCVKADINNIENAILYKMRTVSGDELALAPDVSEGIENRIISASKDATSLEELYSLAKTKRYPHARIRRIIINSFLGNTADDLRIPVPYIRVTGFNSKGAELIRKAAETATLPLITKASDVANLGEEAQRIFSAECRAGDIYALCSDPAKPCGEEKSIRPVIL